MAKYNKLNDILKWHGLFAYFGYISLYYFFGNFSVTRNWFRLGKLIGKCKWISKYVIHKQSGKTTPLWQDICVLILIAITVVLTIYSWNTPPNVIVVLVASYIMFDMITYHIRVLWFDRYEPNKEPDSLKVFSHMRIYFVAVFNFAQTIFLFGILYSYFDNKRGCTNVFQNSFDIATSLSRPGNCCLPPWLTNIQIVSSMIYLIVVISIVASVGYRREELAPEPTKQNEKAHLPSSLT